MVEAGAQGINIEDGGGSPELLAAIADCVARVYAAPERPLKVVAVEPLVGGDQSVEVVYIDHDHLIRCSGPPQNYP